MSDSENQQVPEVNERTRLLGAATTTTSASYNGHVESQVVTIGASTSVSVHESTVPLDQLTDHIQHILVYGEKGTRGSSSSSSVCSQKQKRSTQIVVGDEPVEAGVVVEEHKAEKQMRKRDLVATSLKFATERWMEDQGMDPEQIMNPNTASGLGPLPLIQHAPAPVGNGFQTENVQQVWGVAKNASACAVLGLLSERRQGKLSLTQDGDATLQRLALSTLEHGIKQTSAKDMLRQEMLLKPMLGNKSALQWALDNDCHIFLDDENVVATVKQSWRYGDIEWRSNPDHPFQAWNTTNGGRDHWQSAFSKQWIANFFARWASPRYQGLIGIFSVLVYIGFHLATLFNDAYTDDSLASYEYFYYVLVVSDLILQRPSHALQQPATYIGLGCALLLSSSFAIRCWAMCAQDIQTKYRLFYASYIFLTVATPVLFLRLFVWVNDGCWPVYKINFIVRKCVIGAAWVYQVGFLTLLGFWVGLVALQRDDIPPLLMLQHLILGALHAPEIGDTLYFQPRAASILLIGYLLVMVVFLGSMLTASFFVTLFTLQQHTPWDKKQRHMEAERCSKPAVYGMFIPNVAFALIFGFIAWLIRKINPRASLVWLNRVSQVIWFIIFLPIILLVGLFDLILYLIFK
ncbi:hypothetical protein DM01DRAFT_1369830 [Hesseltinella vesiculosa]|uniref:Uncharacterized protein n=1 Tax=Hesseltinella vesiculosa TaxID=101127 RepID=A0A1X2GV52_9FUNG|nr:hypothetical protein DM01DRAFT_1369830 [Hesseltinella vesiculosa]